MKQTIEIEVPEGKKAVWKNGYIVFEDTELPKTWEEFCKGHFVELDKEFYINDESSVKNNKDGYYNRNKNYDRNLLPTEEAAEAHLALMQLHQLRDCYRQGWVPDWTNEEDDKWCIINQSGLIVCNFTSVSFFLAFPTKKIADEFLHNFEDLIKKAGDLI